MQIQIDITDVAGPKLSDLRNIGLVPDALDGRNLHVSNPSGSRIVVRDYETDETIVSGNGWSNAMQALADHYGVPVQVSRDYGVVGGKSGKVLGFWSPATPASAPRQPETVAEDVRPGMLVKSQADENLWYEVGGVMLRGDRVSITLITSGSAWTTDYALDAPMTAIDPASVKLTKAQAATLRLAAEGVLHHTPSNADWAPRHAWRNRVFTGRAKQYGFKSDIHTQSADALDDLGMLNVPTTRGAVVPSGAGATWLAAHPA